MVLVTLAGSYKDSCQEAKHEGSTAQARRIVDGVLTGTTPLSGRKQALKKLTRSTITLERMRISSLSTLGHFCCFGGRISESSQEHAHSSVTTSSSDPLKEIKLLTADEGH